MEESAPPGATPPPSLRAPPTKPLPALRAAIVVAPGEHVQRGVVGQRQGPRPPPRACVGPFLARKTKKAVTWRLCFHADAAAPLSLSLSLPPFLPTHLGKGGAQGCTGRDAGGAVGQVGGGVVVDLW